MRISRVTIHSGDDATPHIDYYNANPDREMWVLRISSSQLEVSIHFDDIDKLVGFVAALDRLKEALEDV
jgi:hypothetical protein